MGQAPAQLSPASKRSSPELHRVGELVKMLLGFEMWLSGVFNLCCNVALVGFDVTALQHLRCEYDAATY